jgi:hypothetical protein
MDKATWTKKMLHTFCNLYIKAIDMGMIKRLNTAGVSISNSPQFIDNYCVQYIQQRGISFGNK